MKNSRTKVALLNALKAAALPLLILVLFSILTRVVSPDGTSSFGTIEHLLMILRQSTPTLLMAMGMSFNMFAGRWDFSYGAMAVLASIIGGQLANLWGLSSFAMMAVCIVLGVVFAGISGAIYVKIKLPALVVSLGMVQIYEMLTSQLFGGFGATVRGEVTNLAVMPNVLIFMVIVFAIYYIIINKIRFGYDVRSIGGGQEVARNIGVNIPKNALLCYLIGGVFVGISGYMTICTNGTQRATLNLESATMMFDAMICVIIGGYIKRYCNVAVSVVIGVISMRLLISGLLMLGFSSQMQSIVKGLFLLAFVAFSMNIYKIQERRALKEKVEAANAKYRAEQSTS